jgi:hypothetical protein
MTAPRRLSIRNLSESICGDCSGVVPDADYHDRDNFDNLTGAPVCRCRPRMPDGGGEP